MIHKSKTLGKDTQVDDQCLKLAEITGYTYHQLLTAKNTFMELSLKNKPIINEKDFEEFVLWLNKSYPLTF